VFGTRNEIDAEFAAPFGEEKGELGRNFWSATYLKTVNIGSFERWVNIYTRV